MTREGNLLLKHAQAILDEENQIKEELQDLREGGGCQLSIGISGYRSSAMMPVLLPAFYKKRPECRVKLLEAPLAQVTAKENVCYLKPGFLFRRPENVL